MANLDYGRFLKILQLTNSDKDGEALAAIRQVNKMLKEAKLEWMNIIQLPQPAYAQQSNEEILRATTDALRAQRFRETMKARQAALDELAGNGDWSNFDPGWTNVYTSSADARWIDPEEIVADIEREAERSNMYCFAVTEAALASWLFKHRDDGYVTRSLWRRICEHGELTSPQRKVLEQ